MKSKRSDTIELKMKLTWCILLTLLVALFTFSRAAPEPMADPKLKFVSTKHIIIHIPCYVFYVF